MSCPMLFFFLVREAHIFITIGKKRLSWLPFQLQSSPFCSTAVKLQVYYKKIAAFDWTIVIMYRYKPVCHLTIKRSVLNCSCTTLNLFALQRMQLNYGEVKSELQLYNGLQVRFIEIVVLYTTVLNHFSNFVLCV